MKWIIKFCSHKIVRKWIENLKKLKLARYNELEREKKTSIRIKRVILECKNNTRSFSKESME